MFGEEVVIRMKFGRKLLESAHPSFRNYYIAYEDLKEAIKIITGQEESLNITSPILDLLARRGSRTPESQFQELLDNELNKINNFTNVQFSVLMEEIREVLYRLTHESDGVENLLETIRGEVIAFDEYIRLNFTGFRKALKKFDKCNESDSSNWFLQRVIQSDFMCVDMDKLILGLCIAERRFKHATGSVLSNLANSSDLEIHSAPNMFKRSKFFVSPEEYVSIEIELLKNMDIVLAFPISQPVPASVPALVDEYLSVGVRHVKGEVSMMEHVVLFDKNFQQYSIRRSKVADPNVVGGYSEPVFSIRWNSFQSKEGKCVLVKECHSRWKGDGVFEIRLKQQTVFDLVCGKINVDQAVQKEEGKGRDLITEFVKFVSLYRPSVMFSYSRILLESANVFVGLDRDIKFVDLVDHEENNFFSISQTHFHAILSQRTMTVWTRVGVEPNEWMPAILGRPSVSEVVGFSKSIHAEAILHVVTAIDRPVAVGLPHWFLHTINNENAKSTFENMMSMAADEDPVSRGATPNLAMMSSPRVTGKFDILDATSSKQIIHDIVSQKVVPKRLPADAASPRGPSPIGVDDLSVPLLDRAPIRRKSAPSRSLWDELKFVLFGSVTPEQTVSCKIEPKTFLANERTFLNWCFVSFLISALAITLLSIDPTCNFEAAGLSFVAILTIGWSLNVYRLRVIALGNIKSLESLMVSSNGASAVALAVTAALFFTWYRRYREYM